MKRIVSGGQTGVDRAALDVGIELGLEVGGWCPAGRSAEDGRIPDRYPLRETGSSRPDERTRENVRDSDGTLVLLRDSPQGGTLLTIEEAERMNRPLYVVRLDDPSPPRAVGDWLLRERVGTLNVAGPRESEAPGIYEQAADYLRRLLRWFDAS